MGVHHDHAGCGEQHQLDQRMIDHMKHEAAGREDHAFLTAARAIQDHHPRTGQNEADLRHRRAGKRSL